MKEIFSSWLCCQIGAREHYAIPRALARQGKLAGLITDTWVKPDSAINLLPQSYLTSFRERFHPELVDTSIYAFNRSLFQFELRQRIIKNTGWQKICDRNCWFQEQSLKILKQHTSTNDSQVTIFAYSYAALKLFRYAKKRGCQTVLGQIDPGIVEEQIVQQEHLKHPDYQSHWQPAPPQYWTDWQEECDLADRILVNSDWSCQALQQTGVEQSKIDLIPLAYQPPVASQNFSKTYPDLFTRQRPLRVLFLGQIILRKGVVALIQAAELLQHEAIEFWFVGSSGVPETAIKGSNIKYWGKVSRSLTAYYYQQADIFILPTLSDGFGLTQLEAQAWKLPIIASQNCGAVVKDKINGLILRDVTSNAIADALRFCQQHPQQLQEFSHKSHIDSEFSLQNLSSRLQAITHGCI